MKYIKTKDNIYEIVNDYGSSCAVKSRGKRGKTAIDGFIIKYGLTFAPRADTIEELCDCYVTLLKNKEHHIFHYHTLIRRIMDEAKEQVDVIYGAIWTDKGLTYVAKMNNKGELELV